MKAMMFTAIAATVVGATSALAQAPQEAPPNPTITQNTQNEATTPNAEQSNDQRKARMPMRREQPMVPMVPDTTAPASEGASSGTSGSDLPKAPEPQPVQPQK